MVLEGVCMDSGVVGVCAAELCVFLNPGLCS